MAKGKRKLSDTLNKKTSTNVNLTNKLCQIETEKTLNKLTEEMNDIRNKMKTLEKENKILESNNNSLEERLNELNDLVENDLSEQILTSDDDIDNSEECSESENEDEYDSSDSFIDNTEEPEHFKKSRAKRKRRKINNSSDGEDIDFDPSNPLHKNEEVVENILNNMGLGDMLNVSSNTKFPKKIIEKMIKKKYKFEDFLSDDLKEIYFKLKNEKKNTSSYNKLYKKLNEARTKYDMIIEKHLNITNEYLGLINDNTDLSELEYFINFDIEQKKLHIEKEKKIVTMLDTKPLRFKIIESSLPETIKSKAIESLNLILKLETKGEEEEAKLENWINGLNKIHWNTTIDIFSDLDKNNSDEIFNYLQNARKILDKTIYGQYETKELIIQIITKLINDPKSIGNVFAVHGPMGTGKTTIIKDGLAKVLNLPFHFIPLGGHGDSNYLDGSLKEWVGSSPGRIVECLKISKCMNPIFYFDELDKVSDSPKGQEIINTLIHITDPSQNSNFHDKYYRDIPFDISRSIFVFSFNDISKINPILRDRMNMIKVNGFDKKEKMEICRKFILPKLLKDYKINEGEIIIPDDILTYLINNSSKYQGNNVQFNSYDNNGYMNTSSNDSGIRGVKKMLDNIISKLNVARIISKDNSSYNKKINKNNTVKNCGKSTRTLRSSKFNIDNIASINNSNVIDILNETNEEVQLFRNFKNKELKFPLTLNMDIVNKIIKIQKPSIPEFMYT